MITGASCAVFISLLVIVVVMMLHVYLENGDVAEPVMLPPRTREVPGATEELEGTSASGGLRGGG